MKSLKMLNFLKKSGSGLLVFIICLPGFLTYAQGEKKSDKFIKGHIVEAQTTGNFVPIPFAVLRWLQKPQVNALSDSLGSFQLPWPEGERFLIVSFVGFEPDTVEVISNKPLKISLKQIKNMQEVVVETKSLSMYVDRINPIATEQINEKELFKAACCNLSESFETSPAVDASFADAVTGMKQIQLLGLAGSYVQITRENVPFNQGIGGFTGLTFLPGPWLESIQMVRGAGSVVNGFDGMAGQINTEVKKPDNGEKAFLNGYINTMSRSELNYIQRFKINPGLQTSVLAHGNFMSHTIDRNKDSFADMPTGYQWNVMNRWAWKNKNGWRLQAGFHAVKDDRKGGANHISHGNHSTSFPVDYASGRHEVFTKIGYIFPKKVYKSFGIIGSALSQNIKLNTTRNEYEAKQQSINLNGIYQSIIGNTGHQFRTGFSFRSELYQEKFNRLDYIRQEIIPGIFGEYTWSPSPTLSILGGYRFDYHNLFGALHTPRIHTRFTPEPWITLRASAGKGYRVKNLLAEHIPAMVSARLWNIPNHDGKAFGFKPEEAWTYSASALMDLQFWGMKHDVQLEAYRTDFQHQIVTDFDASAREVQFYSSSGLAYAQSAMVTWSTEVSKWLDLKTAWKMQEVKTTFRQGLREVPFVARNKWFFTANLSGWKGWELNATGVLTGVKRLPETNINPENLRFPDQSPTFFTLNAQLSKNLSKSTQLYVGAENLTDFRQKNLIIDPGNPNGQFFDASLVWGPVIGRMVYAGFRWKWL